MNNYQLKEVLNFTADDVTSIQVKRTHYHENIDAVLNNRKSIEQYIEAIGNDYVGRAEDYKSFIGAGAGGANVMAEIQLKDGSTVNYSPGLTITVVQNGVESRYYPVFDMDYTDDATPVYDEPLDFVIPTISISGQPLTMRYDAFKVKGNEFVNHENADDGLVKYDVATFSESEELMLSFDTQFEVQGTLESENAELSLQIIDGKCTLPSEIGSYRLHLTFTDANMDTVSVTSAYIVSDLPGWMYTATGRNGAQIEVRLLDYDGKPVYIEDSYLDWREVEQWSAMDMLKNLWLTADESKMQTYTVDEPFEILLSSYGEKSTVLQCTHEGIYIEGVRYAPSIANQSFSIYDFTTIE